MPDFGKALGRAFKKHRVAGVVTICVTAIVILCLTLFEHWWQGLAVQLIGDHTRAMGLWIIVHPASSVLAVAALFVMFCSFIATRDELLRKYVEFVREPHVPALEITWKPAEKTYVMPYPAGTPNPTIHYRICIVNTSTVHAVNDVVVTLERLESYVLDCVPCRLRLMNNILIPPVVDPRIETFSLNPGANQFIDLMEQNPGGRNFNIWHTVVPQITTQVPAQEYRLTIRATSSNSPPVSKTFELFRNGALFDMREVNA